MILQRLAEIHKLTYIATFDLKQSSKGEGILGLSNEADSNESARESSEYDLP